MNVTTVEDHTFVSSVLSRSGTVLDFGFNLGEFSRKVSKVYECRCVGFEPNPSLIEAASQSGLEVHQYAIVAGQKEAKFHVNEDITSSSLIKGLDGETRALSVPCLGWSDAFEQARCSEAVLVKMDIEGAEIDLLRSLTLEEAQKAHQICVEFHDVHGLYPSSVAKEAVRHVCSLNFAAVVWSRSCYYDVTFLNRKCFSRLEIFKLKYLHRLERLLRNRFSQNP